MASCGLAKSSCTSFRPQDYLQDDPIYYLISRFFKVGAARRATSTKRTFVYFQKKHDVHLSITRAPDVHLRRWLVRWIGLFTTKSLNIVPKLKSKQITMFWHFKNVLKHKKIMIFQGRGRPQGNRDKTDLRLFPKNHDFSRSGRVASAQNLTSRLNFGTISIPFWITRVSHWKPQNCPKTSKLIPNPPQN